MSKPFEYEKSTEIIDYNWQVDKILQNAHPYDTSKNRETSFETGKSGIGPDIAYNMKSKYVEDEDDEESEEAKSIISNPALLALLQEKPAS